ncbi:MAG TPA: serine/threonine-protein kinase, partial [Polyangia bacterium]
MAREAHVFGRYLLGEELAQGGVAQLWRARLASDGKSELVVKTLQPKLVGQPLFAARFAAAASIARLLSHPGIVRIVDDGVVRGVPYLAMERIDGWDLGTLHRALAAGSKMPVAIAVGIAVELCRALTHAHQFRDARGTLKPIVHGDLSPSHVMVRRDGGVTLVDFGVAHMGRRGARARAHLVMAKRGYFAPELLDGAPVDPRADVFAVGVLMHELLVGRHLFVASSERETLRRLSEADVPPPSRTNRHVPPALDVAVLRALVRDPARRFASAAELGEALARVDSAPRDEIAAFVASACARDGARRVAALPVQPLWREPTVVGVRPQRRVADVLAARKTLRRQARARRGVRVALVAAIVVAAALLVP